LFVWGTDRRTVSFLGAGISDYGDLLFAAGREGECASAVRSFLEQRAGWDAIDLQEVRSGSALLAQWPSVHCSVCPTLDLRTFPECMDRKHRTDVRRAWNKLSREPGFELSMVQDLEEFFRLHGARWGDLGERLRGFHCEVAEAFRVSGHLRSFVLRTANGAAAAIYGFARGSTLNCYLSGFDPSMARLSPGAVLLGWAIEQSIADGLDEIDFLRKPEPYKYLWGARDQVNFAVKSF
jgi:CelD/BcsL family acetyltransferase involved in cellulose biosynthesis